MINCYMLLTKTQQTQERADWGVDNDNGRHAQNRMQQRGIPAYLLRLIHFNPYLVYQQ